MAFSPDFVVLIDGIGSVTEVGVTHQCQGLHSETVLVNASAGARAVELSPAPDERTATATVKKTDTTSNPVTVVPTAGLIDGAASMVVTTPMSSVTFKFDGMNWWAI